MNPQVARIARLLDIPPSQVRGLDDLPVADLRALHDQISGALFAGGHRRFAGMAALAGSLPGPAVAKIAEKFLPAFLAARVAELLEPDKARDLVRRVSISYLADIAIALDPVRSRPVVQAIPAARVGEVASELFARGEHGVVAEFFTVVDDEAFEAVFAGASAADRTALLALVDPGPRRDRIAGV
ncbi:MAG: hypothetical protein WB767_12920 [Nocardioides sp.]